MKTDILVLKGPRITEKAGIKAESDNVFTFEVTKEATKKSVALAVKALYNVTPTKVNIVNSAQLVGEDK